jgi:hypothetical protein
MQRFEVRLPYATSETLAAAFPDFRLVPVAPSQTLLVGAVRDQSELHHLFARIADLGMDIIEVRRAP